MTDLLRSVYLKNGRVEVRELPPPKVPPGHALLRLRLAGICNTDLELMRGYYGFEGVPGHEFVADVVESPDDKWIGKRVVGEINLSCRNCDWCASDMGRHCPRRTVLGIVKHPGAFQTYFTLPVANLHKVPKELSDEEAVFTEPVAAACEILDQVRLRNRWRVAVLGDGKLGLLIAQVLGREVEDVMHFGRHANKLAISQAAGLATQEIRGELPKRAFDLVVDATGSSSGLLDAVQMVKPRGIVVLKSTVHDAIQLNTAPIIVDEITLIGSRCGRFEPALKMLRKQQVNVKDMVDSEYRLAEAPKAFERAAKKGALKVLLRP